MPRWPKRYRNSSSLLIFPIVILCLLIAYFGYHVFISNVSFDHSLPRAVISLGIPIVGEYEETIPGWEYTFRSLIYLLTDYDLGNPEVLLKNTIPFMAFMERVRVWEQRPFVFIPELSFAPDPAPAPPGPSDEIRISQVRQPDKPLVLIYHTHSSEMYLGPTAASTNYNNSHYVFSSNLDPKITGIMEVGNHLAEALRRQGIGVIHDTTIHDWPSLSGSYRNSERTVSEILDRYDSIQFVFDVHRDANVPDPIVMIDGKRVARVLLVIGTAQDIPQSHPNWQQNLQFAQQLYRLTEEMYPGLMRPMQVRRDARYNQHLHPHSIVLEIGAVENTIEEALLAAELIATVIAKML